MNSNLRHIRKYSVLILALFITFITAPTSANAKGIFSIKPHIDTQWKRDSNFYKSETNEKEVDTYTITPGLVVGYETDKSQLLLDYQLNAIWYNDQDTIPAGSIEADEYDHLAHKALFRAQTQATERLVLGLDNQFIQSRDPANSDDNSNAVDRYKYYINKLSPNLQYRLGSKFGLGLKYTNFVTDYSDDNQDEGEDSTENRGGLSLFYYFNERTSFDLTYQLWERDYDSTSSDYTSNQVMVNFKRQFNYLTFFGGVGFHHREYDKNSISDNNKFTWEVGVSGKNSGTAETPKTAINVKLSQQLNNNGSGDSYYDNMRLAVSFSHLFAEKIDFLLNGYIQKTDYETSDREDDRWSISSGIDYLFGHYFRIGIKGGYENRDSNITGKDFSNKYILVHLKTNYNFGSK